MIKSQAGVDRARSGAEESNSSSVEMAPTSRRRSRDGYDLALATRPQGPRPSRRRLKRSSAACREPGTLTETERDPDRNGRGLLLRGWARRRRTSYAPMAFAGAVMLLEGSLMLLMSNVIW
jgi:hypothetical protein